jgi:hypothetical protein
MAQVVSPPSQTVTAIAAANSGEWATPLRQKSRKPPPSQPRTSSFTE